MGLAILSDKARLVKAVTVSHCKGDTGHDKQGLCQLGEGMKKLSVLESTKGQVWTAEWYRNGP